MQTGKRLRVPGGLLTAGSGIIPAMATSQPADAFAMLSAIRPPYAFNMTNEPAPAEKDLAEYRRLLNEVLPGTYRFPVRFNHCFSRIILDWLFQDCWYNHLNRKQPAFRQLSASQLQRAVGRMQAWLTDQQLLIRDNEASLQYRGKSVR